MAPESLGPLLALTASTIRLVERLVEDVELTGHGRGLRQRRQLRTRLAEVEALVRLLDLLAGPPR